MYVGQTLFESLYKFSEKYTFLKIFQYLRLRKRFWVYLLLISMYHIYFVL